MIATIVVIVVKTLVTPIKAYTFLISDSFLQIVLDMKCNNPPKQRKYTAISKVAIKNTFTGTSILDEASEE